MTYEEYKQKATNKNEHEILLKKAHDSSLKNKEQIEKSEKCGCFFCGKIFSSTEIISYISTDEPTAECPYCFTDSLIGDASGFPITPQFLRNMRKRWF